MLPSCVGNGHEAYKALEAAFGDNRRMRLTHKLKDALTTRQPATQPIEAYLRDKRDKFNKVETAFGSKKDEIWDYAKVVSLITNLHDTKLHDFLLLEAARTEADGKSINYQTVENAALTFSDGKVIMGCPGRTETKAPIRRLTHAIRGLLSKTTLITDE